MKSIGAQCIHLLLALLIIASAAAPACAGGENCSMPCCRHQAKPAPHQPAAAHTVPCCTEPAGASSGVGLGCRFDEPDRALNAQGPGNSAPAAQGFLDSAWETAEGPASQTIKRVQLPEPFKSPLHLRIQILRI